MARRVTIDGFAQAVDKILEDYSDSVYKAGIHSVEAATNQAQREVRANSGRFGGQYAGGWSTKVEKSEISATGYVYNRRPGLPHLLEKGHALRQGGRTRAFAHVAPAQDAVDRVLMDKLKDEIP